MRLLVLVLGLSLCLPLVCGCEAGGGGSAPSPESTAEARKILSAADAFYRQQTVARATSKLEAHLHDRSGARVDSVPPLNDQRTLVLRAPNEFMLSSNEFRIASNGKQVFVSPAENSVFWRQEAFPTPLEFAGSMLASLFSGPDNVLCVTLLNPGLSAALLTETDTIAYEGKTDIDGTPAHHLVIKPPLESDNPQAVGVTEVWFAAEGDPVLLRFKHSPAPHAMNIRGEQVEGAVVSEETFAGWEFGGDVPAADFAPPEGYRRVASLGQLVHPESPLIGQPAPDVSLMLLDGSFVSLKELQAQQKVVILDFWATWCGPCRAELPFVAKLASDLADQGVVLYAVNQMEKPEQIKAFQKQVDFKFTAALDQSGDLSQTFQVSSLPFLLIIGRDGLVQVVHVGVGPDTESSLREELAALVSGRNIAKEGLPE